MKFYKCKNFNKILYFHLNCVYCNYSYVQFFKNGMLNNAKNASYVPYHAMKIFYLNGKCYGTEKQFTKQSWRKFVKLKAFL